MNLMNRMLSSLFVLTALLLIFTSFSINWLSKLGVLEDRFGDCISLLEARRKSEQLSHEARSTLERLHAKERVAEALKHGEMTLIDAAACFRSLHEDPRSWYDPRRPRPEFDDGENWCRVVIDWTKNYVCTTQSLGQADAIIRQLEAELHKRQESSDAITLPD